jgi:hypothetical protein
MVFLLKNGRAARKTLEPLENSGIIEPSPVAEAKTLPGLTP